MKAITGNRLSDGAVIFLGVNDLWTTHVEGAVIFENEEGAAVLSALESRSQEYADVYLIEVGADGFPAGRERLRETIRTLGPSIRTDLGYQAEAY